MAQIKMYSTQSLSSIRQVLQEVLIMFLEDDPDYDQSKRCTKKVEIDVPLKHLGSFWNSLNIPLVNCEVSLALRWSATCIITSMEKKFW